MFLPILNSDSTNLLNEYLLWFLFQLANWEKNLFGTNKKCVFFFNCWNWEKFVEEISKTNWWKHLMNLLLVTMIGNILVIISVFTYTPLKITPNYFIVSLAMADLTVSACVLPFNIVHSVLGRWVSSLKVDSYFS